MRPFALAPEALDVIALRAAIDHPRAGAAACFEGMVRNHNAGREVRRLEYQAYGELAEREGERIVAEACARWPVERALCVHRVGLLEIGDVAVWVGVSAAHRDAAFAAARWIIDETKRRVPIWKKEHYADGVSEWLHPEGA